ncbi:hypothetical protein EMIHUDRAFT_214585 [Emiliania huxleyi CCMP1516]|uniref:Carbohydrate kinase PfkB domain-containing protein n=2 Tax=Emiliania huxleyi TaxID=2903 RepID=A0A0D3IJ63_EMIH1|nr:hypothetical protein EMIHUDRAFT_214585 [Emiliania huxleyi CCMP1516]EOD11298.1 hypothetical protein EMIHUDRAFT_214585 [Emiliania huxleyi CCMP1516]|mmetsp:Transcript_4203/g.13638  ORF Transcript_4203/g.13638 Transcript_4203/m.13638 type:complete len:334 (+) Transcript_4203:37-1038(+)|eukprot:XP_005763727.1 hypothetical protein EMIHUDRAFT_214585 [Emiliania huxleyi CCMP1516]
MPLHAAVRVLCVGPNPALQKVLSFPSNVELGGVNRAASCDTYVGGKGQGAALALHRWAGGSGATTGVAQFLGGGSGDFVDAELKAAGLATLTTRVGAATRTCTTLLDEANKGAPTELIEPSGAVSEAELASLLAALDQAAQNYDAFALCGTTPPGAGELYERVCSLLLARADGADPLLLLDGFKGVERVLASRRLDILKLNLDELLALTERSDADAAAAELFATVLTRPGCVLAVTDGPRPALIFLAGGGSASLRVPEIRCVNAIGAGDVCTSIFLYHAAVAREAGPLDLDAAASAFAWGLAAACARCLQELPTFEQAAVHAMRERIVIERRG